MNMIARFGMAVLWALLLTSGVGVVWSKHQARTLFIELQGLKAQRDALDIEWGQLKLEQSAWAMHGRVEQTARASLHMVIPRPDEVSIVHCKSGGRSLQFTDILRKQGFANVKSMAGGVLLWNKDINPGGPLY